VYNYQTNKVVICVILGSILTTNPQYPTIAFTREHIHILAIGPNCARERDPKKYINNLIIGTENAIRQLEQKIQRQ